ncbi:unnamed protein product [Euphydryas editha]|uniref:UDP-glucuronosyltransferase n=1 Tax=Euphydryas editha TaxID=104508 RepID=A0AAU9TW57_EUPED|nr:unnamed protein product [Euphydryas editha]
MFKFVLFLFSMFIKSESAKILGVFPFPSISHQVVFRPLMQELAKRGHEVTVITTDPAFPKGKTPQNLTEIDLHDVSYEHWNRYLTENGNQKDPVKALDAMCSVVYDLIYKQLNSTEVQECIRKNKKIDLLIVESAMLPTLILSHIYNDTPVIEFSSLGGMQFTIEMMGAATHSLFYPDIFHRRIFNLTLWEKIREIYVQYSMSQIFEKHLSDVSKLRSIFGSNVPDLRTIRRRNVHMLFLNLHSIWDSNRPVPPNVVYLGGLHQKPQRELPKDLKSYLDSSEHGVIYISFGTNVKPSMFHPEKLKIFTEVLSQLPYDVLWKWDKDELAGRPNNVRISKWLPQSDLLRHPKIRLFITQGGLQSTDEAITAGVPLIGVPMMNDQWINSERYVIFNIGKRLLIEELSEKQLMDAITTVINDDSYRQNIRKLRNVMHDQPKPPLERAVWWTEHLLRHGGAHLRAPSAHLHWTEYYELDVVLAVVAAFVLLIALLVLFIYFIVSYVRYYIRKKVKVN